jgi:hypothetical protein
VADVSFASLSPSLLARKGGARPAMRPQHAALASMAATEPMAETAPEHLEDLGWNDMGDGDGASAPASAEVYQLTPMPRVQDEPVADAPRPVVREQQEQLAERLVAKPQRRPAAARTGRAAFTLRLDADRHLKLRLATTIKGVSAQTLVTRALDALLGDMPELETLAAQLKRH